MSWPSTNCSNNFSMRTYLSEGWSEPKRYEKENCCCPTQNSSFFKTAATLKSLRNEMKLNPNSHLSILLVSGVSGPVESIVGSSISDSQLHRPALHAISSGLWSLVPGPWS